MHEGIGGSFDGSYLFEYLLPEEPPRANNKIGNKKLNKLRNLMEHSLIIKISYTRKMRAFFDWLSELFGILKPAIEEIKVDNTNTEVPKQVQRVYAAMKASGKFVNPRYIAEIDYSINSKNHRLFIYDTKLKKLEAHKVSHGVGGKNGSPHDGNCRQVSNISGSNMSCLGLFKCAETYNGGNGYSLRIDGLNDTNSNARKRLIVIHGSDYVKDSNKVVSGRSFGCPAVDYAHYKSIIDKLKEGSPLLSHYNGKFTI